MPLPVMAAAIAKVVFSKPVLYAALGYGVKQAFAAGQEEEIALSRERQARSLLAQGLIDPREAEQMIATGQAYREAAKPGIATAGGVPIGLNVGNILGIEDPAVRQIANFFDPVWFWGAPKLIGMAGRGIATRRAARTAAREVPAARPALPPPPEYAPQMGAPSVPPGFGPEPPRVPVPTVQPPALALVKPRKGVFTIKRGPTGRYNPVHASGTIYGEREGYATVEEALEAVKPGIFAAGGRKPPRRPKLETKVKVYPKPAEGAAEIIYGGEKYWTDGKVIVKGEKPANFKVLEGREITPTDIEGIVGPAAIKVAKTKLEVRGFGNVGQIETGTFRGLTRRYSLALEIRGTPAQAVLTGTGAEGKELVLNFNAKMFEHIRQKFPNAKIVTAGPDAPALFIEEGKAVGAIMPLSETGEVAARVLEKYAPGSFAAAEAEFAARVPAKAARKPRKPVEKTPKKAEEAKKLTAEERLSELELPEAPKGTPKAAMPKAAKEPWKMSREEYLDALVGKQPKVRAKLGSTAYFEAQNDWNSQVIRALRARKDEVRQAIAEGKPVPASVLKEYPDLAKVVTPQVAKVPPAAEEAWVRGTKTRPQVKAEAKAMGWEGKPGVTEVMEARYSKGAPIKPYAERPPEMLAREIEQAKNSAANMAGVRGERWTALVKDATGKTETAGLTAAEVTKVKEAVTRAIRVKAVVGARRPKTRQERVYRERVEKKATQQYKEKGIDEGRPPPPENPATPPDATVPPEHPGTPGASEANSGFGTTEVSGIDVVRPRNRVFGRSTRLREVFAKLVGVAEGTYAGKFVKGYGEADLHRLLNLKQAERVTMTAGLTKGLKGKALAEMKEAGAVAMEATGPTDKLIAFLRGRKDLGANMLAADLQKLRVGEEAASVLSKLPKAAREFAVKTRAWYDDWFIRALEAGVLQPEQYKSFYMTHLFWPEQYGAGFHLVGGFGAKLKDLMGWAGTAGLKKESLLGWRRAPHYRGIRYQRKGAAGYILDPDMAMESYAEAIGRRIAMKPGIDDLELAIKELSAIEKGAADAAKAGAKYAATPLPKTRAYLERYRDVVLGKAGPMEELTDQAIKNLLGKVGVQAKDPSVRRAMAGVKQWQGAAKIAGNIGVSIWNATQAVINTGAEEGFRALLHGYKTYFSKVGKARFLKAGITRQMHRAEVDFKNVRGLLGKAMQPLWKVFDWFEDMNRGTAWYAREFNAAKKGLKGEAMARSMNQAITEQHFIYSSIGTPEIMANPLMGAVLQFKTFPINQIELIANWFKNPILNKAKIFRFGLVVAAIGGPSALALRQLFAKMFPDDAEEGKHPVNVFFDAWQDKANIAGAIGADVDWKVGIGYFEDFARMPDTTIRRALGPGVAGVENLVRGMGGVISGNRDEAERFIREMPAGTQIKRFIDVARLAREGGERTVTGRLRTPYKTSELALRAIGLYPRRISELKRARRTKDIRLRDYRIKRGQWSREIIVALRKDDENAVSVLKQEAAKAGFFFSEKQIEQLRKQARATKGTMERGLESAERRLRRIEMSKEAS